MRCTWLILALCGALIQCVSSASCEQPLSKEQMTQLAETDHENQVKAEAAIRANSAEWSEASQARDVEKAVSFYADNAIYFADKGPATEGKEVIRKLWQSMLAEPGPGLTFETTGVSVASDADMAWEHGTYDSATTGKNGKVTHEKGKYLVVWKKQRDGSWKAVADIDNTGQ